MGVRELYGWSPRTVTVDAEGKVLSVSVTESRFTTRERSLLLASVRLENAARNGHGILLSEAMDPDNQFAFEGFGPRKDWSEIAAAAHQKAYLAEHPNVDTTGLRWGVRRRGV